MLRRASRHKLPKFPPGVIAAFKQLCETLPADKISEYRKEVDDALEKVRERAQENPRIALEIAEQLAERCHLLLEHYSEYSPEAQALAVGAIRYFAIHEDPFSEETFASGYDDDAKVMNHVLERLGIEDRFISI